MKNKKEEGYAEHIGWLSDEAGVFPNNGVSNHWNSIKDRNKHIKKTVSDLAKEYIESKYSECWEVRLVEEAFEAGFAASSKIVLDMLNEVRSKASEEKIPKLGRTSNFEKEVAYKASIEILIKLQNKLK